MQPTCTGARGCGLAKGISLSVPPWDIFICSELIMQHKRCGFGGGGRGITAILHKQYYTSSIAFFQGNLSHADGARFSSEMHGFHFLSQCVWVGVCVHLRARPPPNRVGKERPFFPSHLSPPPVSSMVRGGCGGQMRST